MNTMNPDALDALRLLNQATWHSIEARSDKVTGVRVVCPEEIAASEWVQESRFSDSFPVLSFLDAAIDLARQGPLGDLADQFHEILPHLLWSQNPNYTEANCSRAFLDGYAYAAFSGPQGPIHVETPRGGFMLMGPNVTYPDHKHAAREVYMILAGEAEWRLDNADWFRVGPGDLIYHDTMQPHATRSLSTPLLAFAGWVEPGARTGISFDDGSGR